MKNTSSFYLYHVQDPGQADWIREHLQISWSPWAPGKTNNGVVFCFDPIPPPTLAGLLRVQVLREGHPLNPEFDDYVVEGDRNRLDFLIQKFLNSSSMASPDLFLAIFETNLAAKLIIDAQTGKIVDANQAAVRFYGYPKKTLQQMTIFQINRLSPEEIKAAMNRAASEKGTAGFLFQHQVADGSIKEVEVFSGPIPYHGQNLLFSIIIDRTNEKAAIREKDEIQAHFRLLFRDAVDGIFITDPHGYYLEANPSALAMLECDDAFLQGKHLKDIIYAEDIQKLPLQLEKLNQGIPVRTERRIMAKSGVIKHVEIQAQRLQNGKLMAIVRDLSQRFEAEQKRKDLESQLFQAQKMESIGRLAGGIAHDLNNLLAPLLGYAELAINQTREDDPLRQPLKGICAITEKAKNLTNQLLAFSKKQVLTMQAVDLNMLILEFRTLFGRLLGEGIEFTCELEPQAPCALVDPGQLEQVLLNLVVNAKDAMAGKGKISIQTCIRETDSEKWSCVRVIDDGPGIPNNIAPLIFEPFFTTKSAGEGSGLGLPTAQGIVMQHGGKIWMERINEQTVFNVELPFCPPQNKIVEPEEFKGKHILLLEDDAMVRNILSEGLRNLGHRVMSFENGAEALHWLDENPSYPVDIAICDMVMPGLNGRQVGLQIAERFPQTKLIMMSGYTDEWNEEISQLLATRHFLQKPFSIAKLERTIRNLY